MRSSKNIPVVLLAAVLFYSCGLCAQDTGSDARAIAAIPVSREPMHHRVFENKWVRVLDVHIPPGDTSLFHKHETPSVFVVLSNTKTGSEVIIEPRKIQLTAGNIWFEGFYDKPRIHRVWNSDTTEFHVMDIELPNRENAVADSPIAGLALLFDEKPVRGYRVSLSAGSDLQLGERKLPVLIINLRETGKLTVNGKQLIGKGDFTFIPAGTRLLFSNQKDKSAELALFELK
jgi:quercetin dioxygenase-like cupin family protein